MKKLLLLLAMLLPAVGYAQPSPAPYTSAIRYDTMGRVTGTIAPDPDGVGPLAFAAIRNSYDSAGRLIKVETGELAAWQSEAVLPTSWSGFTVYNSLETIYDMMGRKTRDTLREGSAGTVQTVTQYSHDSTGRLECTAVRMNPTAFGSLPASACAPGTQGSQGADRITRLAYDAAGQLLNEQRAYGTPLQQTYASYSYSPNGMRTSVTDANGNRAELRYDGHHRQVRWVFPHPLNTGAVNEADYEAYGYDTHGNRTSLRRRDGATLTFQYDALNRMTVKIVPERAGLAAIHTRDVHYGYDLRGLQTYARFDSASGEGITNTYDGYGRLASSTLAMSEASWTLVYGYDANGNRTSVTSPNLYYAGWQYDGLNRTVNVLDGSGSSVRLRYDAAGRRAEMDSGNSAPTSPTSHGYDGVGRLNTLGHDFAGTGADQSLIFGHNPASQIVMRTSANDAYAWTGAYNVNRGYARNGLNQYTSAGPATFAYDANGNLTSDGSTTYVYDVENRLVAASGGHDAALTYDPLGRLFAVSAGGMTTRFVYDGDAVIWEANGAGGMIRAYVHGPGADEPLLWYEFTGGPIRRYLRADHQGSVVAMADDAGNALALNSYDEWGIPASGNTGRFQYTGQIWLPEVGLYHYKARAYSPTLGRFLQTDPVGYDDQVNLYAYVGNDPVNMEDPTGACRLCRSAFDVAVGTVRHRGNVGRAGLDEMVEIVQDASTLFSPSSTLFERGEALFNLVSPVRTDEAASVVRRVSTLRPGPYARESIPANRGRPTAADQRELNRIGNRDGCHTCGTRESGNQSGNWTGDHQPPNAMARNGERQRFYSHCSSCRARQGGEVRQATRRDPPLRRRPEEDR